ncbi:hypothetical protein PanWU01x14_314850 [Parasponia andersonii]|uniref:Uncharacterized protein ycf33 n=1 Tax=Parasponia andersonii TaxID=3476 RepID=A0A2P5ANI2_PARAD|nr:hypothetical protein PanWU01x14_314850 [Parasponia andersonii]
MKMSTLKSEFNLIRCTNLTNSTSLRPLFTPISWLKHPSNSPSFSLPSKTFTIQRHVVPHNTTKSNDTSKFLIQEVNPRCHNLSEDQNSTQFSTNHETDYSRCLIVGAVSVGVLVLLMGLDDQKALALGPEGPLAEEFWDNVRRYALYALTVSTGALYTIFQPIFELLKNPISAILILTILGGGLYIVSQVLSAMVGVSEFAYDYSY